MTEQHQCHVCDESAGEVCVSFCPREYGGLSQIRDQIWFCDPCAKIHTKQLGIREKSDQLRAMIREYATRPPAAKGKAGQSKARSDAKL